MDKQILSNNLDYWRCVFVKNELMIKPEIDFLLENGETQIVGVAEVSNHSHNYIYEEKNDDLFPYDGIDIDGDNNSYEAYIIHQLNQGYDVKYLGIVTHFYLWTYITENKDELLGNVGVIKYLKYCKQIGVNETFISYYADYEMEDLFTIFLFS